MQLKKRRMLDTIQKFINAWLDLDAKSTLKLKSSGCIHYFMPSSMKLSPMDNAQYYHYMIRLNSIFTQFDADVHEQIIDSDSATACVRVAGRGESSVSAFKSESIWLIKFSEDGMLIDEIQEFSDSISTMSFFTKLRTKL